MTAGAVPGVNDLGARIAEATELEQFAGDHVTFAAVIATRHLP